MAEEKNLCEYKLALLLSVKAFLLVIYEASF